MSATFTKGHTFSSGGSCSAANLHAEIESATLAGVSRDNIDRATAGQACSPITFSSSAPSAPVARELWMNSLSMVILAWNSVNSRWEATQTNHERFDVASDSAAISPGMAVKAGNYEVALADGGVDAANVVGIAAHAAVASGKVVVVRHGIVRAAITGTVNAGDGLQLSATPGTLQANAAGPFGQGKGLVARALTNGSGGYAWIILKR